MKTAPVSEIKQELSGASQKQLLDICLRLIKYKKENKELVTYLLFEANDLPFYISEIKKDIDEQFESINQSTFYLIKKSLRKILRTINRYTRYTQSKEAEADLLIYYCQKIKESGIKMHKSTALSKLYSGQVEKLKGVITSLHEDLQHDYNREIEKLTV